MRLSEELPSRAQQSCLLAVLFTLLAVLYPGQATAQDFARGQDEFGPVMRAYLGYLRNEQEVVDDRVSKREITRAYYHRNSSRIRALRQIALRIVRDSGNDYVPELEAVTRDEMRNIFERPPALSALQAKQVINNTFRFLGVERTGDVFYIFERLDPYEQAELMQRAKDNSVPPPSETTPHGTSRATAGNLSSVTVEAHVSNKSRSPERCRSRTRAVLRRKS